MQDLWETPFLYPCRQLLYLSYFSPRGVMSLGVLLPQTPTPYPLEYPRVPISKLPPLWPASHSPWLDKGIWLNIITKPPAPPHTPCILYIQKGIIYIGISRGPFAILYSSPPSRFLHEFWHLFQTRMKYCTIMEACNKGLQFHSLFQDLVARWHFFFVCRHTVVLSFIP